MKKATKKMEQAKISWNDAGMPVSTLFNDVYFSHHDGLAESRYVFLAQNQLPHRWLDFEQTQFVIMETGFGTGLNFLATCQAFIAFSQQNPAAKLKKLRFISVEKYPLTLIELKKTHQIWPELQPYSDELTRFYPSIISGCHQISFAGGNIILELWFADVADALPQLILSDQQVDCWYLDGFAPSKNPEMWSDDLFNNMARLAKKNCTIATFTAAGFVRRGLINAGFSIQKAKGFSQKREMLIGLFS